MLKRTNMNNINGRAIMSKSEIDRSIVHTLDRLVTL